MFRRRGHAGDEDDEGGLPAEQDVEQDVVGEAPARAVGPWDSAEPLPQMERVDLGGLLIPGVQGMELRVEMSENQIVAATVVLDQSAVQMQAFAAPRTEGIWDDVRHEIAVGIGQQGGIVDQLDGPLGPELRAQVPVQLPDGTQGVQLVRFIGADGPRWFLRGVISGQGAVQPNTAAAVEQVFRDTVVVRGEQAMAPRDPIPLRFPAEMQAAAEQAARQAGGENPYQQGDLNPFARGPEITEVR